MLVLYTSEALSCYFPQKLTPRESHEPDNIFFTQAITFNSELDRVDVRQNTSLQVPILSLTNLEYTNHVGVSCAE